MTEHGTTQVIIELAKGYVGGASFELSLEQVALRIPKSSIYLAALCFADDKEEKSPQHRTPSPPFSAQQQERFSALQKQYLEYCLVSSSGRKEENATTKSDNDGAGAVIYQLSPRLCPTVEQLRIVRKDIRVTMERLEALAQRSMQELLQDESLTHQNRPQKTIGKPEGVSRSAKAQTEQRCTRGGRVSLGGTASAKEDGSSNPIDLKLYDGVSGEGSDNNIGDDDSLQEQEDGSLDDLLSMNQSRRMASKFVTLDDVPALIPNENSDEEDDDAASSWVEVKRKTSAVKPLEEPDAGSTLEDQKPKFSISTNHETSVSLNAMKKNAKGELSNKEITTVLNELPREHECMRLGVSKVEKTKVKGQEETNYGQGGDDKPPTLLQAAYVNEESHYMANVEQAPPDLQQKLQQNGCLNMERDVSILQRQLVKERATHAKEMARVKQQHDDLVQGLQLRLYISETKLRTYQEALEEHVNAVANNIAVSTNTPDKKTSGISVTSNNDNNHGDVPPSSSLISKAWSQNKTR